jgi:hypothetical protein
MTYLEVPYVFPQVPVVLIVASGLITAFYKQICGLFRR